MKTFKEIPSEADAAPLAPVAAGRVSATGRDNAGRKVSGTSKTCNA